MPDAFEIKRQARRDIHAALSVSAQYIDQLMNRPVDLRVRWLTRMGVPIGDMGGGISEVLDAIDRVKFDAEELFAKKVTIRRGGQLTFSQYDVTLIVGGLEPSDGPVTQTWTVTR